MDKIIEVDYKELADIKQKLFEMEAKVKLLNILLPKEISLSELSDIINVSRQTLRYHLTNNYNPKEHFYIKNNKIYISVSVLPAIRNHYGK